MAEFVFAGPDMYECSDDEIFDACFRVRNRYSILHNLIFEAFKSGVPAKEIHVRVSEPSTRNRKDILHMDRIFDMDTLGHCRNIEELFEEVFKDMVDRIYEERKKRDMDGTINSAEVVTGTYHPATSYPATSIGTCTYYPNPYKNPSELVQEEIQKIVEEYLSEINEKHEDMGEFYYEYRKGEKYPHMLRCRAKDFKGASFGSSFDADANNKGYTKHQMDAAVKQIKRNINEHHSRNASRRSSYLEVIFNPPATIVLWSDGSKTVVKCGKNEKFDPEKGLAMCIAKKVLGNKGNYYELFKEWLPKEKPFFVHKDGYVNDPVDLHGDNDLVFKPVPFEKIHGDDSDVVAVTAESILKEFVRAADELIKLEKELDDSSEEDK